MEIDVRTFGVVGNGLADDTVAMQAALDSGEALALPYKAVIRTSAPLISRLEGQTILGAGGSTSRSVIVAGHTSGPVLQFCRRSPRVEGVRIDATPERRASGNPLAPDGIRDGHGILFGGDDTPQGAAVIISRQIVRDVWVTNQPTDGIHSRNGCELSEYFQVTVQDCVRHGFVFDNGTISGMANKGYHPFHWSMRSVRAFECGGNGYVLGMVGATANPIDFYSYNLQALGCAYDATKRISDYLVVSCCNGAIFDQPDFEDQQFNRLVTALGNARTQRTEPTKGIHVRSSRYEFRQPFFSGLMRCIDFDGNTAESTVISPRIFVGSYGIPQVYAFGIPTSCISFTGRATTLHTPGATQIFRLSGPSSDIRVNGLVA